MAQVRIVFTVRREHPRNPLPDSLTWQVGENDPFREYTLLLSPESFDFTRPVTVTTNGKVAFEGGVSTSVATLLKWAAIDADRAMLFGAELHVKVT